MRDRHQIELGKSMQGKLVRFIHERNGGPVHKVIAVDHDGMLDLHDTGGLFAPHLFTVADDIAAIPLPEAKPDPRDEGLAKAREALKAFLHLVTPGPNDDDRDGLEGLPDSFQFELVWAPNADVPNAPKEQFQDPTITAGQIRRARSALAALDAAKGV